MVRHTVGIGMLLMSMASLAQGQRTFDQWDSSHDGQISQQEFMKVIHKEGWLNRWDKNNDDRIDKDEFDEVGLSGNFRGWDANTDGYLGPQELYTGIYSAHDENEDGHWDRDEWGDAAENEWFGF